MNRLMHMGIIHGAPDSSDAYIEAERKFRKLAHRETESEKRRRESVEAEKLQPLEGLTAEAIEGFQRGNKPGTWERHDAQKADPYAHLKAAQDAGKPLQCWHTDPVGWWDYVVGSGGFSLPVECYRIKPEPAQADACPTLAQYRHMQDLERMSNHGPMPARLCDKCGMKHLPAVDAQYRDPAVDAPVLKVPREAIAKAEAAGFRLQCFAPGLGWTNRQPAPLCIHSRYRVEPRGYSIAELRRLHKCGMPVQWWSDTFNGWITFLNSSSGCSGNDEHKYRLAPHESEAA